jgi:hypothetical protein
MKKRLYCITNRTTSTNQVEELEYISPTQASALINSSVDHIHIDYLNAYEPEEAKKLILLSVNKLRPKGVISININNIANICKAYIDRSITDTQFTEYVSGCKSIFSVDSILSIVAAVPVDAYEINYFDNQFMVNVVCQKEIK